MTDCVPNVKANGTIEKKIVEKAQPTRSIVALCFFVLIIIDF